MRRQILTTAMVAALLCGSAGAQLLPGPVGALPGQVMNGVLSPLGGSAPGAVGGVVNTLGLERVGGGLDRASLRDLRRARLQALIRANRDVLEGDREGNPVRRGEVIVIDPSPTLLERAQAAGFSRLREDRLDGLDIRIVILGAPKGDTGREALDRLRGIDPAGQYELNHVYEPAGGVLAGGMAILASGAGGGGAPIGMIDGGVAAHPALAGARVEQRGFVANAPRASGHGTAVASLLVGRQGRFSGAAAGQSLLAADVYGGEPASGSAEAIARALGWMSQRGARVVNISLVGPPNRLIERAVRVAQQRGMTIVAAVGNDGPAAPPQYPASYAGVIAVTGVDAKDKALIEAGQAAHLDFAAPGADMAAAVPGGGYATVRGTSFAAPLVTARFAVARGDPAARLQAVTAEVQPGRGKVGRGILCKPCRIVPATVNAKK